MSTYSLEGVDGNVFFVQGYVTRAMRREGKSGEEIAAFVNDLQSDDYDHALRVAQRMVDGLNGGTSSDDSIDD